jgi:hypothetical protein
LVRQSSCWHEQRTSKEATYRLPLAVRPSWEGREEEGHGPVDVRCRTEGGKAGRSRPLVLLPWPPSSPSPSLPMPARSPISAAQATAPFKQTPTSAVPSQSFKKHASPVRAFAASTASCSSAVRRRRRPSSDPPSDPCADTSTDRVNFSSRKLMATACSPATRTSSVACASASSRLSRLASRCASSLYDGLSVLADVD